MLMHDILMLRNTISVKCLGNVSWKMLEESKALPSFSKEKIPNSRQFAQSRHFRQIATGKHLVPSQIGFPCDGFNATSAISYHEVKACLVSYIMSVIHPVVLPCFSSLLLPCGWQLAAITEQPCRRLLEGRLKFQCNHPCSRPGAGTHPFTKYDRKSCNNISWAQPGDHLGRTAWSHRGSITYKMCEILIKAIFLHHIKKIPPRDTSLFNWITTCLGTKCKSQKTHCFL